jgi:pyruvate kinase
VKIKNGIRLIATLPPYVDHLRGIIDHPAVDALRFNTVSPLAESRGDLLARLQRECGGKRLWIDLKGRQLRINKFAYLPDAYVELTHKISVDLPATVIFRDGTASLKKIVDGNKLILGERPPRVVGEGEPINILDPSLKVEGYLTPSDREYVEAASSLGLHDYMPSFVEQDSDVEEVLAIDPKALLVAKIESRRGLDWMRRRPKKVGLMAARDDLYVNMGDAKGKIIPALEGIIAADRNAMVASHLLESLTERPYPAMTEIADIELMLRMGYKTFMFSDTLCFRREPFRQAASLMSLLLQGRDEEEK